MCDVGQGDTTVLESAPGEAVVVDAGPDPTPVDRCLRRLGITRVALLVLSHFHADHVEGVPGVLRGRVVSAVVVSPLGEPPTEDHRVLRWLDDAHVPWRVAAPGDRWTVGDVGLRVLWPTRILRGEGSDPNNASVVMVADVGGVSVLLGGDLETAAQEQVLASGAVPRVDVVKVPHHGSAKQAPGWALAARPRIALIGVGLGNDYGHPYTGTVNAYRAVGAVVGRTDLDGDLAVVLDDAHRLGLVRRGTG
jgi:competence protein ComEC